MFPALGAALALLLTSTASLAQNHLVLSNHHVIHGKVVSSTPDSVTFDHVVDGNSVDEVTYTADQLEPVSFYLVRYDAVDGDAAAMVELGKFCLAHGESARARDLFESAHRLDPSIQGIDSLQSDSRESSAATLLAKAQSEQAAGKPYEAWQTLQDCIRNFGETPSAQKGKDLVKTYYADYRERYVVTQDKEDAEAEQRHLGEVGKVLDRADKMASEAMAKKNLGESLRGYKEAAKEYEHGIKELDRLAKEHPDDADLQNTVKKAVGRAVNGAVEAHLNSAGVLMTQTAYQEALAEANQALAIDPDNSSAKSMRTRIATVSGLSRW
jgi:tetratricopeptide (TPR) repeat protein